MCIIVSVTRALDHVLALLLFVPFVRPLLAQKRREDPIEVHQILVMGMNPEDPVP